MYMYQLHDGCTTEVTTTEELPLGRQKGGYGQLKEVAGRRGLPVISHSLLEGGRLIEVQLYKHHGKIKASLSRVLENCL